ncbi:MAG: DNA translocase FtsK [Clostridiales bacterium]|nr:DNA translocase FtsK [Clostridiales bacterium]
MAKNKNKKRKGNGTGSHDVLGMSLIVVSAFLLLCIVIKPILGVFSEAIFGVMLGVFGIASYPMLLGLLITGILLLRSKHISMPSTKMTVCTVLLVLFALVILQLATTHAFLKEGFSDYIGDIYAAKYSAGGVIMGVISFGLKAAITEIACYVVFSIAIIVVVLVMTDAVNRIRNGKKKAPEPAPEPSYRGMMSDAEARRVIPTVQAGLFVGTIEPKESRYTTESGVASDLREDNNRRVSDYAETPVMTDAATAESRSAAAKMKLYGDADAIRRQSADEFRNNSGFGYGERSYNDDYSSRQDQPTVLSEPYVRTNRDAEAQAYRQAQAQARSAQPDMPRRIDYDGPPDNFTEVYFPIDKHFDFNDEGIVNAATDGDIKSTLQAHAEEQLQRDVDIIEAWHKPAERQAPPPPVFDVPPRRETFEPVEKIIDASDPVSKLQPSMDDALISSLDTGFAPEPKVYPLESEKFKQDDIIDAFEVKGRFISSDPEDKFVADEDDEREEILDGTTATPITSIEQKFGGSNPFATDPREKEVLSDDIITGGSSLKIVDGPAVDLTERRDNVSDIISGEDLSGMYITTDDIPEEPVKPVAAPKRAKSNAPLENQMSIDNLLQDQAQTSVVAKDERRYKTYTFTPPPIDLLKEYEKQDDSPEELNAKKVILEQVVSNFLKVQVTVTNIVPGPQVTRYEIDVPSGTSVKGIEGLSTDIAYELACSSVRVEAPIPNKRAVGVEVPNRNKAIVGLREIVSSTAFSKPKSPLVFSVGKDLGGDIVVCDLEKVPHLLIAGQTGSGKSAGLNSLITSLLYKSSPDDLRFILIDPKRVEFSKYRGMPHLLFEKTISEPNDALNALKWAAGEMDRRFTVMAKYSCSKLSEYNALPEVTSGKIDKLPHIVIIIDELANLMQSQVSGEIENRISQIAALARAAGIHLIVATQRPSADVITGTIKANLTSRIAFAVKDATNSRIIIDEVGAEALRGNGDMLYYPQDAAAPRRVQGSFVDGPEILTVVNYLKEHYECDFDTEAEQFVCGGSKDGNGAVGGKDSGGSNEPDIDPYAERVMALALKTKQISVSVVQRRFSIGYARAARIIDSMEDNGFIGPSTGNNKPRDVLMTVEQYKEMFGHAPDDN